MKKKVLVVTSVAIIALGSIGGYVFAQGKNVGQANNNKGKVVVEKSITTNRASQEKAARQGPATDNGNQEMITRQEPATGFNNGQQGPEAGELVRNYINHCENSEEMIRALEDNGLRDMAKWVKEGDYKSINEHMHNMSAEDYKKMLDLMNEKGHHHATGIVESIGKEEMVNMHNSVAVKHNATYDTNHGSSNNSKQGHKSDRAKGMGCR